MIYQEDDCKDGQDKVDDLLDVGWNLQFGKKKF